METSTIKKYADLANLKAYHKKAKEEAESKFVQKVDGKGLSTNDYTNEEKQKLASLEKINPDDLGLTEEQVAKLNAAVSQTELEAKNYRNEEQVNAAVTSAVDAAKLEIANKQYQTAADVQTLIASSKHLKRKKVDSIDNINVNAEDAEDYIYLVPTVINGQNLLTEWIVSEGTKLKIGDGYTDLEGYLKATDIEPLTDAEIQTIFADTTVTG